MIMSRRAFAPCLGRVWFISAAGLSIALLAGLPAVAQEHASGSQGAKWIESWGASPQQPIDPIVGGTNPPTLSGETVREVAHISAGGNLIRLRLTNEYTDAPTAIGDVHVALSAAADGSPSSAILPGTDHVVTFGGVKKITLAPNAPALSDPIDFPVKSLANLAISIYVSNSTQPATPHSLGQQTAYIVSGDQTGASSLSGATTTTARYVLSGVDVLDALPSGTIVTLGDSITDGYASTIDANARWPDDLARRLQAAGGTFARLGVADEGISGNRLRLEGIGPNAQSRFDRDVLSRPGLRYVTVLEGINDIGFPVLFTSSGPAPTPESIIQVYQQLIQRAHELGVRIFGCTLTPFQGAFYYSTRGEATREAVNSWILTSGQFDGVIDFAAAVQDPANPLRFRPIYDSGDHLHPNDAGYRKMAQSIDLHLFQLPPYRPE